jgi:molecular chaperone GrpE
MVKGMKKIYTDKKKEEQQKQIDELNNKYLRALADYQNLERRSEEEKVSVRRYAAEEILKRILPVIDIFQKANDHLKDAGLSMGIKEWNAVLEEQDVIRIKTVGHPFNPHEMECVEVVEGMDSIVIEETLSGYKIGDKILRIAQVKVGKQNMTNTANTTNTINETGSKYI